MSIPLVSISCITYNHVKYIRECLEGLIMQRTNFEFEILVHDDASSDSTAEVIKEYETLYPNIIKPIYQIENQYSKGVSMSKTYNFPRAKGEYIAMCEGDDYWTDPYKLQKQVDFLQAQTMYAGCAHQSMVLVDNKESHLFKKDVSNDITVNDIIEGRLFHTATIVFRRDVLELFVNAPSVLSSDRLLYFCIAFLGKIRYFNECMCIYRLHEKGMSSCATIKQIKSDLKCIPYLKTIFKSFPMYRYKSYVYATIGLSRNGTFFQKLYYLFMSFVFSFSYFPRNILKFIKYFSK